MSNKNDLVKVLAQSIFYVKKFYDKGIIPPSTVFVADRNECLTLHVNDLIDYLDMDLDWKIAPSSAHTIIDLVLKLQPHIQREFLIIELKEYNSDDDSVEDFQAYSERHSK